MNLATRAAKLTGAASSPVEAPKVAENRSHGLLPQPASDFDGVAIMLMPQNEDQASIAPYAAVEMDNLHCTLLYLGDAKTLNQRGYNIQRITDALRSVAAGFIPVEASLGGLTRFSAAKGDNDPVVLSVDSKGVHKIRDAVIAALEAIGVKEDSEHGFTAHLTLGYVKQDQPTPVIRWERSDIFFDRIRIGYGGDEIELRLDEWNEKADVRHVASAAGVRRYGLPIGSVIGSGPGNPQYELDLGLPDPLAGAAPKDRARVERKVPSRDLMPQLRALKAEWSTLREMDYEDPAREASEQRFMDEYDIEGENYDLAESTAAGPWVYYNSCRSIRSAAYDLLGFDSNKPEHTSADISLNRINTESRERTAKNAEMHAMILLDGIAESDPNPQNFYRGVTVSDPEKFVSKLKEGQTFDMPLASFADSRVQTERFGTDVTFALQKGSRGVKGASMGAPPGMDEDHPDFWDAFEDEDSNYEYITGGRFRITGIRENQNGYTVMIRQVGVFDPNNGLLVKDNGNFMVPWFSYVFDTSLAPVKKSRLQLVAEAAQQAADMQTEGKHLPGEHDQSSHGRQGGISLRLIEDHDNRIEYELDDDFISNAIPEARIKFRQGKGDVSHKIWVVGRAPGADYLGDAANIMWQPGTGKVEGILVSDPFRRKGVATRLWDMANELAKQQGIDKPTHSDSVYDDGAAWIASLPEEKDVHGGMNGLRPVVQRDKPVQRKKRYSLRDRVARIVPTNTNRSSIKSEEAVDIKQRAQLVERKALLVRASRIEVKATPKDGDADGFIFDGTPQMRPAPIGTPVIGSLTYAGKSEYGKDFQVVADPADDKYHVGPYGDGTYVAIDENEDYVVDDASSRKHALELLDKKTRGKTAKKKPAAKKTAAKPLKSRAAAAATKKKTAAKKTTAKKAPAGPKVWQRPWSDLTAEEQKKLIDQRGKIPDTNPLTKQPWTPAAIKKKREGRTAEAVIARAKKNGWRLVTDDAERHQLGIDSGKPMPPGWSHVFVYEGPGADKRKYTVQGLDWAHKLQPHQTQDSRHASLEKKFTRYRALTKKLPLLDRRTKKDLKTDDTALVVRIMMLSGGRVDSGGGKNVTGSRGITSLNASDITIKGNRVLLQFDAKSGHQNDYQFIDADIARRLEEMKKGKKPGEQMFPKVNASDTIAYIKSVAGNEFTNHDLRTSVANIAANKAIRDWMEEHDGTLDLDDPKAVAKAVKEISAVVGVAINDTPTTAYNSYIDPAVFAQMGIPESKLPARGAK